MKVRALLPCVLLLLFLLSACSASEAAITEEISIANAGESLATAAPPVTQEPLVTDAEPKSLSSELDQATATPAGDASVPRPEVTWDSSPESLIISATYCCGLTPEFVQFNHIPDAQVWGDGRILWTQINQDNERSVYTASLTQDQMAAFLQGAADAGFFGWEELYTSPMSPSDQPSKCLYINLESAAKKVCEYFEGAPPEFHELYADLAAGMDLQGQEYAPERGYLLAFPVPDPGEITAQFTPPEWDASQLGLSLAEATSGTWIEGLALARAWELINRSPTGALIQEGEAVYQISLQVPGVSFIEPPLSP